MTPILPTFYHKRHMMKFILKIVCAAYLVFTPLAASALELPTDIDFARQGERILARLEFRIPEGYHAYAYHAPGGGKPTKISFVLADQGSMPILYPEGIEKPDTFDGTKITRVYTGTVVFYASLPVNMDSRMYSCTLELLLCSSRHCMPITKTFTGEVPADLPLLKNTNWNSQAEKALNEQKLGTSKTHMEEGNLPPLLKGQTEFGRMEEKLNQGALLDSSETANMAKETKYPALKPSFYADDLEIYSLGQAILFGLLAGFILNAMPCVLPVLTLKVTSLLTMGEIGNKKKKREFRIHNLCFAAGILSLFTLLGAVLGVADGMWGQLYQNHTILICMLLLVFLMSLSMLGVFTLPAFDMRFGSTSPHPGINAYFTGFVSTFLATPCSGPLLGGVLAWAFTQPLHIFMSIFWSIGFGMGLPYIVFAIWPNLARILPRPGEWMLVLEKLLGFMLLGTALYLLSILPEEKYLQILALLILAALCAWFWGHFCGLGASRLRRIATGILCTCFLAASVWWILQPEEKTVRWDAFSAEEFHKELGEDNMMIEFTADWCPNCKYLEATVLTPQELEALKNKYGLRMFKADLTNANPEAEKLLEMLGSRSIPLTALFAKGNKALYPLVLRDLYDKAALKKAAAQAFANKTR